MLVPGAILTTLLTTSAYFRPCLSLAVEQQPRRSQSQSQSRLQPSGDYYDIESGHGRPTRYESTVLGRRLLAVSTTGVISTIFPPNDNNQSTTSSASPLPPNHQFDIDTRNDNDDDEDDDEEGKKPIPARFTQPPSSVASLSISLPDYLSDCDDPSEGNPTLLFLDPSTSSRNTVGNNNNNNNNHNRNLSLSLSWWDQYPFLTGHRPHAPADLPRLSMIGYVEEMTLDEARDKGVVECFVRAHPDAKLWLPGDPNAAHPGRWVRMVVQEVYWMGGFGDRHWIGWFDVREWRNVAKEEWEAVRLPGEEKEKKKKEKEKSQLGE